MIISSQSPESGDTDHSTSLVLTDKHHIIAIGASTGGLEAIKQLITGLPPDFGPPIFIVWHMAPEVQGIIPGLLNKLNTIYAAHAIDGETISPNRIYVAPPDHHLLIEEGMVRLSRGPKENHFRPAVDPLFRSAAYTYGNRVIGIVLSGALDDGTAGLWRIKYSGGTAIVQDPVDAEVPSMPESAIREVEVDYCLPVSEMAALLMRLSNAGAPIDSKTVKDDKTRIEIGIAAGDTAFDRGSLKIGELSPITCPECHGVLSKITEGKLTRYRCHTGHAFSVDTLLALITEKVENNLYFAMSGIEESMMLLNHIGDHLAEINHSQLAGLYFKKANNAAQRADVLRNMVMGPDGGNDKLLDELKNPESGTKE